MQPYVQFVGTDHSGEDTGAALYLPDVNAANYADTLTLVSDLLAALADITIGGWRGYDLVTEVYNDVATLPASPYAQRERRAYFKCVDVSTGRPFVVGVPCPDMTDMAIAGTDAINLSDTEVAAYVTALQTFARSPWGNAMAVVSGYVSGRSN